MQVLLSRNVAPGFQFPQNWNPGAEHPSSEQQNKNRKTNSRKKNSEKKKINNQQLNDDDVPSNGFAKAAHHRCSF